MGNKIITEKDFWMCTSGAVPAQLQSTQKVSTKKTGEKYITVRDKSTSSFIDFGCTKYMLLMALAVAALVVAAVVVGIITVATGGLGLIAIGALAGLAGGVLGAVVGSLLCGQKMAAKRQWIMPKTNLQILGADTITGNCTMTCPVGGTVKFAPNIKSWTQAIGLASLNYVTKLTESALGGAMIGAAAPAVAGLFSGTATLALPTFASIGSNVAFTFTGFGGLMGAGRALAGADNVANQYAFGEVNGAGDAARAGLFGAVPEVEIAHRIVTTGQVHPWDALLLLYFLNIKAKTPAPEVDPTTQPEESAGKNEEPAAPEESKPVPKVAEPEIKEPAKGQDGEAYEDPKGGRGPDGFGDTRGKFSNRLFDPENAGGPIENLSWQDAEITVDGIQQIRRHTDRFGEVPENNEMIQRLEQIQRGELAATDADRRFYTHELREYQRYQNLGIPDGVDPGHEVWNNTHTAALEDYQLIDFDSNGQHNLYTPEIATKYGINR